MEVVSFPKKRKDLKINFKLAKIFLRVKRKMHRSESLIDV